ncbi:helix-turn-helix domain-containing protein [Primorskyibacter sp. S187A]|uniref:helix-turn-helix domain-containing protein n=1 Tax=Primorskyibacter sp. S187A TaxID=3415130 RepID=UPI003C7A0157
MAQLLKSAKPGTPSPAELRDMFGANLKHLCRQAKSISALCRDLGINRTQFNRYLSGESFPRPDVLHRICTFFDVDARILLEPVETITQDRGLLLSHPTIAPFLGAESTNITQAMLPDGLFRFLRRSFIEQDKFVEGLVLVYREQGFTFVRGHEAKEAMSKVGLTRPRDREFRGFFLRQENGVASLVARRNALTGSFTYLHRVPSIALNTWTGYTIRTTPEMQTGKRITRLVWEHLGNDYGRALKVARGTGYRWVSDLSETDRAILQPDEPVS